MKDKIEVRRAIQLLLKHIECVAWLEFGDRGNPCYDPYNFDTEEEHIEDAYALAAVKIVMPKGSVLHQKLSESVAQEIGCKYVTYDWLIKALSRIVASSSYKELADMMKTSLQMRIC
ncbi:hypothetical protein K2F43_08370 [Clostridium estertheticum]|uniref:hypothetical protein n=1 Tax=Clostridium estertheticum TaxID=238834 RepID=UPI001C6F5085|nr:hypothetical protein [Clostridium estertheticum]MBW9171219.1 hypothetical protein [Clostridium estertheticum]WLC73924.1 hypothetical protein KTC99_14170 [Clostridium estertheticum]